MLSVIVAAFSQLTLVREATGQTVRRIMPLGDSLTAGIAADPADGAYRTYLEDRLVADGFAFDFVGSGQKGPASLADKDHEGHGGYQVNDIANNVNSWLSQFTPDVVLLMIGTNDIRHNADPGGTASRLSALLDQMATARPATHIVVASIPTQTDLKDPVRQQALSNYNAAIPGIVSDKAAAGKSVSYVNVLGVVPASDIADGQHPTQGGHSKIADAWFGRLTQVLPVPSSGVKYVSDLNPTSATNGYGPYERDRTNGGSGAGDGRLVTMQYVIYPKGLGVVPASSITYNLGGQYTTFAASVGIDDVVLPDGSVVFQVFVDDVKVYDSGKVTWSTGPKSVSVNVAGKSTLRLVTTDAGDGTSYDHADWGNARLLSGSGSPTTTTTPGPTTTTAPAPTTTTTRPPTTTTTTTTTPPSGSVTYVSDLNPTSATNGYGPYERDRTNGGPAQGDGQTIAMQYVIYPKGLGVVPASSITYNLGGQYTTFAASVGIDDVVLPDGSVVFQVFVDDVKVYDSGKVTWSTGPKSVSVNVAGKSTLRLVTTDAGDGTNYDHADWGNARLLSGSGTPTTTTTTTTPGPTTTTTRPPTTTTTTPPSGVTYVSDLNPTSATNGYGPYERDRSNGGPAQGDGQTIAMQYVIYPKGLGVVPASSITYNLGGQYTTFAASVGIDDVVLPDGSVVFQVFVDDVKVYDSGKVTWSTGPKSVSVNVAGKSTLRLVTTDAGDGTSYDHADWGNARLIR